MRVILLLPSSSKPHPADIAQRLEGLRCRYPEASVETADLANPLVLDSGDVAVVFAETPALEIPPLATQRVAKSGQVLPLPGVPLGKDLLPDLDAHPFSRLGPRGQGDLDFACFHYFPYSYLYRLAGLGPVNAFGHRIDGDFRVLRNRAPDHKLIVCFGGSAVWSICTTPKQSFPAVLEHLLNARAKQENRALRVSVLNFGVPGAVVLNSMQHFLLYAADLRPDIVIAHDGVNDLFYGCTSDPWLLREHGIVYQQQLEYWASMLHDPRFKGDANLGGPIVPPSGVAPLHILKAYIRRKREFMQLVRGFEACAVWGLQPFARSKKALSPLEHSRIQPQRDIPIAYEAEFQTVRGLYDLLKTQESANNGDVAIDFDDIFNKISPEDTVMADMVHLDKNGEKIIAETYAERLWPYLDT